ncbi:hypothetical protein CRENBAI_009613 [Crenichthys baileyi]|uniref:Uncharacterized protein n=1 Tax=Crenichthys baileyi TaxID=28760 RepID=A0AAV9RC69_9TELE
MHTYCRRPLRTGLRSPKPQRLPERSRRSQSQPCTLSAPSPTRLRDTGRDLTHVDSGLRGSRRESGKLL